MMRKVTGNKARISLPRLLHIQANDHLGVTDLYREEISSFIFLPKVSLVGNFIVSTYLYILTKHFLFLECIIRGRVKKLLCVPERIIFYWCHIMASNCIVFVLHVRHFYLCE